MDKDSLAQRLIYLTGRSDPHRINIVFERVLYELDTYINENIPASGVERFSRKSQKDGIRLAHWKLQD